MTIRTRYLYGKWITILLPMIFSVAFVVNTLFGYYGYETEYMDDMFGISWGSVLMLYLMHNMFGLCRRHLMMILYLAFTLAFTFLDSLVGIPISYDACICILLVMFFVFVSIYLITIIFKKEEVYE